ncbi:MAG TPA: hypothetical protein VGE72_30495 [Azospirillum sp.]
MDGITKAQATRWVEQEFGTVGAGGSPAIRRRTAPRRARMMAAER